MEVFHASPVATPIDIVCPTDRTFLPDRRCAKNSGHFGPDASIK
jgi:hypothetical protein